MNRRKRIALYGGTFDPVHAGHLAVAEKILKLFALDEVVFVPAHVAPHKREREVSPPLQRYAMLALATQHEPRFLISTIELDAPEKPYTVDTLARMREKFGEGARLFFVMGADSWEEIETWREWRRVLALTDHIVMARPGHELDSAHLPAEVTARIVDTRGVSESDVANLLCGDKAPDGMSKIYLTDAATVDLSATAIRRAVREEGAAAANLGEMLPPSVADYIKKYSLYKDWRQETND